MLLASWGNVPHYEPDWTTRHTGKRDREVLVSIDRSHPQRRSSCPKLAPLS
jgi:hypothetical protein